MLDRVRLSGLSKFSSSGIGAGGTTTTTTEKVSDLARDRKSGTRTIPCTVLFLNDTQHTFHLDKRAKGGDLLELVFDHLDLQERDYFGLQFVQSRDVVVRFLPAFSYVFESETHFRPRYSAGLTPTSPSANNGLPFGIRAARTLMWSHPHSIFA